MLYGFTDDQNGALPEATFVRDALGNLYSTANSGRDLSLRGNVFRLSQKKNGGWSFSVLYGFANGIPEGENPGAPLIFDRAGNLYSTTQYGGSGTGCSFYGVELCLRSHRRSELASTIVAPVTAPDLLSSHSLRNQAITVRREKALVHGGMRGPPGNWIAPPGSNRSSGGGNKAAEASGGKVA